LAPRNALEVGFQCPRPVLTRHIDDASELSHRCRIVERDIEPTELAGRQAYQLVRIAFILNISRQGDRATSRRLNFRNQPVQFVRTAGADDHTCALGCEQHRGGATDSRTGACDNGDLACECRHRMTSYSVVGTINHAAISAGSGNHGHVPGQPATRFPTSIMREW
jgi:hypothetical protein